MSDYISDSLLRISEISTVFISSDSCSPFQIIITIFEIPHVFCHKFSIITVFIQACMCMCIYSIFFSFTAIHIRIRKNHNTVHESWTHGAASHPRTHRLISDISTTSLRIPTRFPTRVQKQLPLYHHNETYTRSHSIISFLIEFSRFVVVSFVRLASGRYRARRRARRQVTEVIRESK